MKTTLAFDTATSFGAVCGTESGRARRAKAGDLLAAIDELVADPAEIEQIVVGRGPGSFTSIRIGLAMARSLSFALGVPVAGASTLDAYAGAIPVIDARRGEVFTIGPRCVRRTISTSAATCSSETVRCATATLFEEHGGTVPPDDDPSHIPDPLLLAAHAGSFGPAERVLPLYVREPDAKALP